MKVLYIALIAVIGVVYSQNLGVAKTCPTQCKTFVPKACKSLSSYCDEYTGFLDFKTVYDQSFGGTYPDSIVDSAPCKAFFNDMSCLSIAQNVSSCANNQSLPICFDMCSHGLANCYKGFNPITCSIIRSSGAFPFLAAQGDTNCKRMSTLDAIVVATPTPTPTPTSSSGKVYFNYLLIISILLAFIM
ncbi:1 TM domain-containing transmembrane protein [Acrasis kona]|uniref:1 TM domain-containing transmembrane protein n=1 Tax=Acrasis kona TaxID=1008807 RepID=A0AAW2ZBK4_9EUKA